MNAGDPAAEPAPGDDERNGEVDTGEADVADMGDVADGALDDDADVNEQFDALVDGLDVHDVDVAALVAERDQFKDTAMRVQADFENFRKRSATQSAGDVDRATGRLAEAFLPVLDAAEAAYVQHPDEVGPLLNVMLAELRKHGLESLDLESQPFDPEIAEAVAHEPGDGGDVVVAEVLRSGYRWKGKTLRPAMVRTTD